MANYHATINNTSDGNTYLMVHRGDVCENLKDYFMFDATISDEGAVELYFDDSEGDIPDPIDDRDQYDTLQAIQDDPAFVEALKIALAQAIVDLEVMEKESNPDRFEYWFEFTA